MSKARAIRCLLCALHLAALSQAMNSVVYPDGFVVLEAEADPPKYKSELDFGGAVTGDGTKKTDNGDNGIQNVYHPELVKSLICGTNSCSECQGKSSCWHGVNTMPRARKVTQVIGGFTRSGLEIKVPPSATSAPINYIAEVWARCPSDGGKWKLDRIFDFENGILQIYLDDKLQREITSKDSQLDIKKMEVLFPIAGDEKARIKLVFRAEDPQKAASVVVRLKANLVDPMVEDCMVVKDCLDVLGKGGNAGFILRNNNKYQLKCLQGGGTHALPREVQAVCIPWKSCLSDMRKMKMITFLKAGQGKDRRWKRRQGKLQLSRRGGNLNDLGRAGSLEDPLHCVDPETDDPESWECECLPQMIERCGSAEDDECFRNIMCGNAKICSRWKDEHCQQHSTLDEKSVLQNQSRSMMSQRGAVSSAMGTELDNSLSGKCSQ